MLLPHITSRGVLIKFNLQERKKIKILFLQDIMYYAINYLLMNSFLSVSANRISDIHAYIHYSCDRNLKNLVSRLYEHDSHMLSEEKHINCTVAAVRKGPNRCS